MTVYGPKFDFDNSYALQMEGFYAPWQGEEAPAPKIIRINAALAAQLGVDAASLNTDAGAAILAGNVAPEGAAPLAQAYAGHQFGGFSEQLGDGRALLLGEVVDADGDRYDIQLKGSGRTPFSRGGDGKAAIGPVLREYIVSEAMFALGVPTTRALAAVATGEEIERDGAKPGAVLTRVASSHLRVGTFQFFAARGEWDKVKQLADYAIARHFPDLSNADDKYVAFLAGVARAQAVLVAHWTQIGFVHGVMNTDNMTISGETIDYGPCAFLDQYDPAAVFSSIDRNGRYAFANQPLIARWNLARLAETLLPLIDLEDQENANMLASEIINGFAETYTELFVQGMRAKIGLASQRDSDAELINDLFSNLEGQNVDFTDFFRALAGAARGDRKEAESLFDDAEPFRRWLTRWEDRLGAEAQSPAKRADAMDLVNPIYIPRNHRIEEALAAAEGGNFAPFETLLDILSDPYTKRLGLENYEGPAPADFGPYKTFCGT